MKLIGTPDRWFYTGMPGAKAVGITPYLVLAKALDFPPNFL
jgi:hypothetical protein